MALALSSLPPRRFISSSSRRRHPSVQELKYKDAPALGLRPPHAGSPFTVVLGNRRSHRLTLTLCPFRHKGRAGRGKAPARGGAGKQDKVRRIRVCFLRPAAAGEGECIARVRDDKHWRSEARHARSRCGYATVRGTMHACFRPCAGAYPSIPFTRILRA